MYCVLGDKEVVATWEQTVPTGELSQLPIPPCLHQFSHHIKSVQSSFAKVFCKLMPTSNY